MGVKVTSFSDDKTLTLFQLVKLSFLINSVLISNQKT